MSQQSLFERIVSNESENRTTKSVIKFYLITQLNPSGIESCILSGDIIVRNLHVSGIWKIFQFASTIYTLQPWRWRHEVWDTFEFRIIPEENMRFLICSLILPEGPPNLWSATGRCITFCNVWKLNFLLKKNYKRWDVEILWPFLLS